MSGNYVIVGSETEKVRGIILGETISEKEFEDKKSRVCAAITAGLITIDAEEPLELVAVEQTIEAASV